MSETKKEGFKTPAQMVRRIVARLQRAFYKETIGKGDVAARPFYRDLNFLQQAATFPAKFLQEKGWRFDEARYEAIFGEIIAKVHAHGTPPGKMLRRGAYILHAVQDHWRHNWDQHYEESKALGAESDRALAELVRRGEAPPAEVSFVEVLAATHDALRTGRPKKTKPVAKVVKPSQEELF